MFCQLGVDTCEKKRSNSPPDEESDTLEIAGTASTRARSPSILAARGVDFWSSDVWVMVMAPRIPTHKKTYQ